MLPRVAQTSIRKAMSRLRFNKLRFDEEVTMKSLKSEEGKVGYLVLYLLGAPVGLLILLWLLLGNNLFGAG